MANVEDKSRTLITTEDSESDTDQGPDFEPVTILPPQVEVPTDEETDFVLIKARAKLYRFDTTNKDEHEWKERGTGEIKLLQNKENHSCRVVMRRDKTLKVCANHFITPWMELKPSVGSNKAFVYTTAADFADEIAKSECFAVKFSNSDSANLFKDKFNEAKVIVSTQCKLYCQEDDTKSDNSDNEAEVTVELNKLSLTKESNGKK